MSQSANSVIEEIKGRLRLEELVAETLTLTGKGRTLSTVEHDSLKLRTDWQTWAWYSRDLRGDIFDWYQLQHGCDFRTALGALAGRAGVELAPMKPGDQQAAEATRRQTAILEMAARYYHAQMLGPAGARARAYCATRGWDSATVAREAIGYVPDMRTGADEAGGDNSSTDNKALSPDILPLHRQLHQAQLDTHPVAKAVLMIPPGHLVYVHRERGRVVYLSARSIEGKRHWNLPSDLVGPRRLYTNEPDGDRMRLAGVAALVEGQADAISLGQLGVSATALCGVAATDLGERQWSHVGLDGDAVGQAKGLDVALAIDPATRVVMWPAGKDANEWLLHAPTEGEVVKAFIGAPPALVTLAETIRGLQGEARNRTLRRLLDAFDNMEEITATDLKPELAAAMGESLSQFNRLLKAREKEREKGGEKPSPERYEFCAGLARAGLVFEQCVWDEGGKVSTEYAVRLPSGEIKTQPMVDIGSVTYVPYPVDMGLVAKDVVLFPAKAVEYGTQRELVQRILAFIHKYLDVDPFYERLAAYYVLLSWVYDLFETLPYMRALGDYGTGKTRFLQTIGSICYRPMFVSGASTTSPIFRMIDMFQGTLVIDEADFGNSDAEAEIIKILNVGYYRGGVVLRSEKDPTSKYDEYWPSAKSVYGPKILATRRPFTDRATESRCLTKRTTTARPRPEIPFVLGRGFWQEAQGLRNQLLLYRLRSHRPVELTMDLADTSVEPRLNQVTMALKAMVDDETMRAEIDLFIRAYNEQLISDRQMTLPAVVVQALVDIQYASKRNLMGEEERDFSMKGIADKAQALINDIDPGTTITAKKVGQVLSEELGLTGRQRHARHRRVELVVTEDELRALMVRYGVTPPGGKEGDHTAEERGRNENSNGSKDAKL
jgi:DNA primase